MNLKQKCDKVMEDTCGVGIHLHPLYSEISEEFSGVSMLLLFPDSASVEHKIFVYSTGKYLTCVHCKGQHSEIGRSFCSMECYQSWRKTNATSKNDQVIRNSIKRGEKKFSNAVASWDFLTCPICTAKTANLRQHIKIHSIGSDEFKKKYGFKTFKTGKEIHRMSGSGNPGWQHGGKLSAWSPNFIHGYDKERHEEFKESRREELKDPANRVHSPFFLEHWIEQFDGDVELAKEAYTISQTRDLNWFINKFGEEEGRKRHAEKTEKWLENFKRINYSEISQVLFREVAESQDLTYVYFATHDRSDKVAYENKEYRLSLRDGKHCLPDYIDLEKRKVIEFDGMYWHTDPEKDSLRDWRIMDRGYSVLHVREKDFMQDPQSVVEACIEFLNDPDSATMTFYLGV